MMSVHKLTLACLAAAVFPAAFGLDAYAQAVAITNARIHTITGPVIDNGTVVILENRIEDVGADIVPPDGARIIDAMGRIVTPGFLDSHTFLGLSEIDRSAGPNTVSTSSERLTSGYRLLDGLDPQSTTIPVTRVEGISRAVVAPRPGAAALAGQTVLIDLGGDRVDDMVHRDPAGVFVVAGDRSARLAGGSRAAALQLVREALDDARDYASDRTGFFARVASRTDAPGRFDLEALGAVLRREIPLVVDVHRASDILAVIRMAEEENVRLVLSGVTEGWKVAASIVAADVPVVIRPMENIPSMETPGATLENAARLDAAGVTVAFASYAAHSARNLMQYAGNAVSHGMGYDAALRAVTRVPAEIWGIGDRYGAIEPGMDADIVIWSGDPFEVTTSADMVFIRGREISADTRPAELLRRYRTLP